MTKRLRPDSLPTAEETEAPADSAATRCALEAQVMDVAEVAAFLNVGTGVVYELCGRNQIPHRRVGKHLRFSRQAIVRWLGSCGPQVAQKGT